MKYFYATLINFIIAVKNNINFESVAKYLENNGVEIIFKGIKPGNERIRELGIENDVGDHKSITISKNNKIYIVIDNRLSSEDKFHMLLHESSHILLGHISTGYYNAINRIKLDNEAEAFTFCLLHTNTIIYIFCKLYKNAKKIVCVALFGIAVFGFTYYAMSNKDSIPASMNETVADNILPDTEESAQYEGASIPEDDSTAQLPEESAVCKIYITPTGKKYHRIVCHTINADTAVEMDINKAIERGYAPCKLCSPDK